LRFIRVALLLDPKSSLARSNNSRACLERSRFFSYADAMIEHPCPASHCFRLKQRVYWEDTDGAGIVYYANYLRFLERARTEWLRSLGVNQTDLARSEGLAFVVRSVAVDFLRPARLDDELSVSVASPKLAGGAVDIEQYVTRGHERLVQAQVKLACVRISTLKPARIPRLLRELLAG
jgi:acyl-CoA thioester hydrolase